MIANNKPLRALLWVAVSSESQADDEKTSLPQQEADLRARAEREGWIVVDVLVVPGFSRRYLTWAEFAQDAAQSKPPISAPMRMLDHWGKRDFDLIAFRDGSRFGRSQSIFSYFVERTIDCGARLYSLLDGWISSDNYRMYAAMGGYGAAGEIDKLVRARDIAMDAKAAKGLPTNPTILMSHKLLRDDTYRPVKLVVDPALLPIWRDAATLLLEGLGWMKIGNELYRRFGHVNPNTGKPFHRGKLYKIMLNPTFWGHTARHFTRMDKMQGRGHSGLWCVEAGHPVPEGVEVYYNTHEAVFGPDDPRTESIKAELRRRDNIRGRRSPNDTPRFSGLLMCAQCGGSLGINRKNGYVGYYCPKVRLWNAATRERLCGNRRHINSKVVQQYIDGPLRWAIQADKPDIFLQEEPQANNELASIEKAIQKAEQKARKLVMQQAENERDELAGTYMVMLDEVNRELKRLRARQTELAMNTQAHSHIARQRKMSIEEIANIGVDKFWALPDMRINQILHMLLGTRRLVVDKGKIVGSTEGAYRKQRKRRSPNF